MLANFADSFQDLYGQENVTMNIHLLRHMANSVRQLGPLWSQSAFGFETNNGVLIRFRTATNHHLQQIAWKYSTQKTMLEKSRKSMDVSDSQIVCGKKMVISIGMEEKQTINDFGFIFSDNILHIFSNVKIRGVNFSSKYSKEFSTIDYFLEFRNNEFFAARFYFMNEERIYVFVDIYTTTATSNHLKEIESTNTYKIFDINEITTKLIYMKILKREIVTKVPNRFEKTSQ